jgi:hypothetical protein
MPLKLTDDQLDQITEAARSLDPDRRVEFLREVASALSHHPELGDGLVARTVFAIQRKYWIPPKLSHEPDLGGHPRRA